jgi:tetratricopeptide (TPR) repeat protein
LVELGYVDPEEVAARRAAQRTRSEVDLRHAVELFGLGHGHDAITLLNKVIAEDAGWIAPRQVLAEMRYRAGDWREARAHLAWLEHHGVVTPKLALIVGAMALAGRDLPAALEELEYAAYVEPEIAGVQSLLGTALVRLRRWEAAKAVFERAVQQNPADSTALDGLAVVALHQREFEDAAHWALEALEHDMRLLRAHYRLGIALVCLNRIEPAIEAFHTCTRLDPSRAAPLHWLARIANEHQRDTALATSYRERARAVIRQRRDRKAK